MGKMVPCPGYTSGREARRMTNPDVSAYTGLSMQTLARIERGESVRISTANKIMRLFEEVPISPAARELLGIEKREAATGPGE